MRKKFSIHYIVIQRTILFSQNFSQDFALFTPLSALTQMCDNWFENIDNGKLTGVVFLIRM